MKEIDCKAVGEGLWELFKQHPELQEKPLTSSAPHEQAAISLLQALCQKRWDVWAAADELTQATARALLMDFFLKISFPRPGEFQGRRWRVDPDTPLNQALAVIAQELARSHPQQTKPH